MARRIGALCAAVCGAAALEAVSSENVAARELQSWAQQPKVMVANQVNEWTLNAGQLITYSFSVDFPFTSVNICECAVCGGRGVGRA